MALKVDPEAPNVHYHLGLIYKERGELNRASAFFQRALEVNPTDRDARYWLDRLSALLLEAQQHTPQARNPVDAATPQEDPPEPDAERDSDPGDDPDRP
jgi:tetratricopeptide (TPR) repeat protein